MQGKSRVRGAAAAVVVIASVGLGAFSLAGPAAADSGTPAGPGGTWGQALAVPGVNALAPAGTESDGDEATAVSCSAPGECTAAGYYLLENPTTHAETFWPMAVSQTDGVWGRATALAGSAKLSNGLGGKLTEISCASAGNCSATGSYTGPGNTTVAFLVDEVDGTWGADQALPDAASLGTNGSSISAISCPSAGDCAAVGSAVSGQFILDEVDGSWGGPLAVPGLAGLGTASNAGFDSVSCADAGDCTAIGTVTDASGVESAVVVTETGGAWGDARLVPGQGALPSVGSWGRSVSCPAVGDCAAIGGYEPTRTTDRVWVADEVDGAWGAARPLAAPLTTGDATGTVSCATPGNCAVAGMYRDAEQVPHAFLADETNGVWQASQDVPGLSGIQSNVGPVSCAAPGDCAVVGTYDVSSTYHAFSTDEVNGTWGAATAIPGVPATVQDVSAISCSAPGYCSAVGPLYGDRTLVSEGTGSVTTATVAASTVSYGDEEAAPVSVTVTSPAGGTPTGTVTVTAAPLNPTAPACTATLVGGAGTCAFPAMALPAGSYHLTAIYNGDAAYAASASAGTTALTVTPDVTTTSLTLSAATAAYGHESAIRLTAVVTPRYGGPFTGTVVIHTNASDASNIACTITVTAGGGSCLVPDTQLGVGVSHMTAYSYSDQSFTASVSASHALTTVKGADTTTLTESKTVVAYGHENEERLSVRVLSRYHGAPAGQVVIKAGTRTLCVISLRSQAGSCLLSVRELGTGTYAVVAGYEGNAFFAGSTSGRVSLKVT